MNSTTIDPPAAEVKRVNFLLSERAYGELTQLSRRTRRSMTEIVRVGLGLARSVGHSALLRCYAGTPECPLGPVPLRG